MSYRIFERGSDKPLEIFGVVVDCPTLKAAQEVEDDIAYIMLKYTDVELDTLEVRFLESEAV